MKRLTSHNILEINDWDIHNKQLRKLQSLENIEEKHNMSFDEIDAYITEHKRIEKELGVDLVTLLKALKNGVYAFNGDFFYKYTVKLNFNEYPYVIEKEDDGYVYWEIKDYGKTWAFTKEELEK